MGSLSLIGCLGVIRLECQSCKNYFDFDEGCANQCICPSCRTSFVSLMFGIENGLVREVNWWYGREVPSEVFTVSEFDLRNPIEKIPHCYIEVYMHLKRAEGQDVSELEAISYFFKRKKRYGWGIPIIIVIDDDQWMDLVLQREREKRIGEVAAQKQ